MPVWQCLCPAESESCGITKSGLGVAASYQATGSLGRGTHHRVRPLHSPATRPVPAVGVGSPGPCERRRLNNVHAHSRAVRRTGAWVSLLALPLRGCVTLVDGVPSWVCSPSWNAVARPCPGGECTSLPTSRVPGVATAMLARAPRAEFCFVVFRVGGIPTVVFDAVGSRAGTPDIWLEADSSRFSEPSWPPSPE